MKGKDLEEKGILGSVAYVKGLNKGYKGAIESIMSKAKFSNEGDVIESLSGIFNIMLEAALADAFYSGMLSGLKEFFSSKEAVIKMNELIEKGQLEDCINNLYGSWKKEVGDYYKIQ